MSHSYTSIKKACLLFGCAFLVSIPIVWASLFFNTYHGDLTRVGKWMESDFAGKISQPSIDSKLLISSPIEEADILVIGDSFSQNLHWQSVLVESNLKVSTILWSQIDQLCEDFPTQLKNAGFKGEKIIIESIERIAERQFEKSVNCKVSKNFPKNIARTAISSPSSLNTEKVFNINGQFIAGLETIIHSLAIRSSSYYPKLHNYKSKGSHIYKINNGCDYFSHHLCQFGLFFHEDYRQPALDSKTIEHIKILKKRLNGYQTTWVVIPNKSSIYQRDISPDFWSALLVNELGPNLHRSTKKEITFTKDIYAPNDTHYSNQGYIFLGKEILNYSSSKQLNARSSKL